MALTYQSYNGRHNRITDSVQIAKDGDLKLYYIDEPIDILREQDPDIALDLVSELVDETTKDLQALNLGTKKLNDLDMDIYSKSCPTNKITRRIFNNVKDKLAAMESKLYYPRNGKISVIPRIIENQRNTIYIYGPSGAGKSYWCSKYAKNYQTEFPGNRVFLLSRKAYDPAFDNVIVDLIRIPLNRKFVTDIQQEKDEETDPIARFHDSLLIFDDFEGIDDPTIKKAVLHLKDTSFQLGRQYRIDVCSIQHKGLGGNKSLVDLCEANMLVGFPKMNLGETMRLLQRYCSFNKEQMERIFNEDMKKERWCCVIRPNIIVTEHFIKIID